MSCFSCDKDRKSMSTPAENTRFRKAYGGYHIKQVRQTLNSRNVSARKTQQIKEWLAQITSENKSDTLSLNPQEADNEWENIVVKTDTCNEFYDSQESSEISFNLNKAKLMQNKQSFRMASLIGSVNALDDFDPETISVGLGSSASVSSKMLKRKLEKAKKMNDLSALHQFSETNSQSSIDVERMLSFGDHGIGNDLTTNDMPVTEKNGQADCSQVTQPTEHDDSEHATAGSVYHETEVTKQNTDPKSKLKTPEEENEKNQKDPTEDPTEDPKSIQGEDILESYKKRLDEDDKSVFYDMFELLITKLTTFEDTIKEIKTEQVQVSQQITHIQETIKTSVQAINEMDTDIADVSNTNIKLIQAAMKAEEEIEVNKKCAIKLREMINVGTLVFKGVVLEKDVDLKESVKKFLKNVMKLKVDKIEITSAQKMGKSKAAPLLVKFQDPNDIKLIFDNVSSLKNKKNKFDRPYIIRRYESEEKRELKEQQQDIMAENRALPAPYQATMSFQKGQLVINKEPYVQEIQCPTIKEVLLMSKEQEAQLNKLGIHPAGQRVHNGSLFQSFSVPVHNHEEVKAAYLAIKNEHMTGTHLMCGFRILGA